MLLIDIVEVNRISEGLEESRRKLRRLEERTYGLLGQKQQSEISEEIHALAQMSETLQQISSLYADIEKKNLDYLEEARISCERQPFQEWSIPAWVFQLLE